MIIKDLHSTHSTSSDTFKPRKLVFIYLSLQTGKAFSLIFCKPPILVQTALYFSSSFLSSIGKGINLFSFSLSLNALTYPLILGNIQTNGFITSSKYPSDI